MKRLSLHIGLNEIDPAEYGTDGKLENCLNDCNAMTRIAADNGFTTTVIQNSDATCARVAAEFAKAADALENGDYFLVTYAGHGSQVPDEDNEETDGMNETWVLYDRMMVDNEIYNMWGRFKEGVKLFCVSDSCHSGTLMRPFLMQVQPQLRRLSPLSRQFSADGKKGQRELPRPTAADIIRDIVAMTQKANMYGSGTSRATGQPLVRLLPPGNSLENYVRNRDVYREVMLLSGDKRDIDIKASLLYISGCQDNQTSGDGPAGTNGVFTGNLKRTWNNGAFTGCYLDFYSRICGIMPADQSPNFMKLGTPNRDFENEKPFVATTTTTSSPAPSTATLRNPSLSIASQWKKSDGAPYFDVDKGGNPYYYVELATEKDLFNAAANKSRRTAANFYASYQDQANFEGGSFLRSSVPFQLPDTAWDQLKSASRLYYRIGAASDTAWSHFRLSVSDADFASAPAFELVAEGIPAPADTGTSQPAGESPGTADISGSVGKNGDNNRDDVKTVQALLNKVPAGEGGVAVKLIVDGIFGIKTLNAIKGFQMYWGYDATDEFGIVRPGSDTFNELVNQSSRSLGAPVISGKEQLEEAQ